MRQCRICQDKKASLDTHFQMRRSGLTKAYRRMYWDVDHVAQKFPVMLSAIAVTFRYFSLSSSILRTLWPIGLEPAFQANGKFPERLALASVWFAQIAIRQT
jgi:hypothetical protein